MAFLGLLLKLAAFIVLVVLAHRALARQLQPPVSAGMHILVCLLCLPLPLLFFYIASQIPETEGRLGWGVVPAMLALFTSIVGASAANVLYARYNVYFLLGVISLMLFCVMAFLLLLYDVLVVHHTVV